ncbi:S-adenosyl-L-methionine-dependent methyltransferase [Aspergillus campestris IBT 28561]|uniref:S-adenosyl-L-methionine-dependent methyltransferase n=1 Tax=Aspergillus campestris (strain IBT 28561) TaxID=1392248 RepID=A0A2I1DGU6_ASPC2|nr:S-adenosyl-L-methionine-dependent methyltransferase [Aspergillus campestris IBT 28561]PKY09095.1 S-adenosyl-L-methionine-dependent methyltransferase [Aspergillus campestris IBT 28561]
MSHKPPLPSTTWNPTQYLKYHSQRTRPVHDLLSRIPQLPSTREAPTIIDLGCGPGNSTAALRSHFPTAHLTALDSSPDMLARARAANIPPPVHFALADLRTYVPPTPAPDLFVANAVLHWVDRKRRLPLVRALLESQPPGGVFAYQVPDNLAEPSHVLMREVAREEGPQAVEDPLEVCDFLEPVCGKEVDVWRTTYYHVLRDHDEIVEWVSGTGLRPFLEPLGNGELREAFLERYRARLEDAYPAARDGASVLFPFPRLFVVAVRK